MDFYHKNQTAQINEGHNIYMLNSRTFHQAIFKIDKKGAANLRNKDDMHFVVQINSENPSYCR